MCQRPLTEIGGLHRLAAAGTTSAQRLQEAAIRAGDISLHTWDNDGIGTSRNQTLQRAMALAQRMVTTLCGNDRLDLSVPGVVVVAVTTPAEPRHGLLTFVHQDPLNELGISAYGTRLEERYLGRSDEELREHDVMATGDVRLNHRKGSGADERTSRQEVTRPSADQGPQHVDVTIKRSRMLISEAPRDGGLADAGRAVEKQQAWHAGDHTQPREKIKCGQATGCFYTAFLLKVRPIRT